MGKAIVINGLQVINPLCTVTFSGTPAENTLREYLETNTSINDTEQQALTAFVGALIDANLWDKMSYFYPLLGNNLKDALLEVVSPSTEDLFVSNTTGLSVSSRKLYANNRQRVEILFTSENRIYSTNLSKCGMIIAGGSSTSAGQGTSFFINRSSSTKFETMISGDTYRYPSFEYNRTLIKNMPPTTYPRVQREVFVTLESGVGYLYDGTTLLDSNGVTVSDGHIGSSFGVLINERTTDYEYDFFAITEGMTTADWLVFHPLLMTFLVAIGKRTE